MGSVHIFVNLYVLTSIYAYGSLSLGSNVHCSVRREISPCTCRYREYTYKNINVVCEAMTSFQQVISALKGKFENDVDIILKISHSSLDDLPQLSFQQLGINIHQLWLQFDNLSAIPESVFSGMHRAEHVSLSDNILTSVPQNVLRLMPKLKILDISRAAIENITSTDFQGVPILSTLLLSANNISLLEANSLPTTINKLHIGHNNIKSLNGTLRSMGDLEWIFINNNQIDSLEGELPEAKPNKRLSMIQASYNQLATLPQELREFGGLDVINLGGNEIRFLSGAISNAKKLKTLELFNNHIEKLETEDFAHLERLEELDLQYNYITSLNNSLLPLKNLRGLKLSYNQLTTFTPSEISGLKKIVLADYSNNNISEITPKGENSIESPAKVVELRLQYNRLKTLEGSIGVQIKGILRLNISHNLLETIGAMGLEGLKDLKCLDLSHNRLLTLGDGTQGMLTSLEDLRASFNLISYLHKDLYAFPQLCWADLSYNHIEDINNEELLNFTQCTYHGVNMTLRIYLIGNQGICNKQLSDKIVKFQKKHDVELHGLTECSMTEGTQNQGSLV